MHFLLLLTAAAPAADVVLVPGDDIATKTAVLNAGDNVFFDDGTFLVPGDLYWTGTGTADSHIHLEAKSGSKPILQLQDGYYLAHLDDSAYVDIIGLTFEGADGWEDAGGNGLEIGDSSNITVEGCEIRNFAGTGLGIGGSASNLTVTKTSIHDVNGTGLAAGCYDASCWMQDSTISMNLIHTIGGDYNTGIYIYHGGQNNIISDNVVFGTGNDGIYVGSTEFGKQNQLLGNAVWDVASDGIAVQGAAIVQNNVVFDAGEEGIRVDDSDRHTLQDVVVSFNTIVDAGDRCVYLNDWVGKTGMVFANNVLSNPIGAGFWYDYDEYGGELPDENNVISTNHVTGQVDGWDETIHPNGVIPGAGYADFVDAEGMDFYPAQGSALINAADPNGNTYIPAADFNGAARDGATPDVGAYEWSTVDNPGWALSENFKTLGTIVGPSGSALGGCCHKDGDGEAALPVLPLLLAWVSRRRR
jgi:uncharacterized protein (TIGR03382 family)